jgi:hypothetical protein
MFARMNQKVYLNACLNRPILQNLRILFMISIAAAAQQTVSAASFADDIEFLRKHTEVIVLSSKDGQSKVAVAPAWQGRVMTSTAGGDSGDGFGWINRELIASGKLQPHINVFGGEDRFWLGPEGGQFALFFSKGAPFDLEHWFTPPAIDTMPYAVGARSASEVEFKAEFAVTNFSGTRFEVAVNRKVRLLSSSEGWKRLGVTAPAGVSMVAFATENKITNEGQDAWKKETGLLSIWILGMFKPSPSETIVVPIKEGSDLKLGVKVTSDYFGKVPAERLSVKENVVFLSGDGKYRSKIGINPKRTKGMLGSYDSDSKVLTIVKFTRPRSVADYVNSQWKMQTDPYSGDAANSYNDGPPTPGAKPLGPFYELESSSPAAALAPKKSLSHTHWTIHLKGSEESLDVIARGVLGIALSEIKSALPK